MINPSGLVYPQAAATMPTANDSGVTQETFSNIVTVDHNASAIYSGSGLIAYRRASAGHVDGCAKFHLIPAYTATGIVFASDFGAPSFAFDETLDWWVEFRQENGRTRAAIYSLPRTDVFVPVIVYALAPTARPNTIEITFSEPVEWPDLTGISLNVISGAAMTISYIKSGSGTSSVILRVSRNFTTGDVVEVVFDSSNTVQDLDSNALPAQSAGVFFLSAPTEISGFTAYRNSTTALDAASGQWASPGSADALTIQQTTAGKQPDNTTLGYDGAQTLRFVPANSDNLVAVQNLSSFVTTTTGHIWVVTRVAAFATNATPWFNNDQVFGMGGYLGIAQKSGGTDGWVSVSANYDGVTDATNGEQQSVSIQRMQPYLHRWRHNASTLYAKRDRNTETAGTTSGATGSSTAAVTIGSGTTVTHFTDADVMALVTSSAGSLSAESAEGVESFFMTQPWGGFLRWHQTSLAPTYYAVAGNAFQLPIEQIHLTPSMSATAVVLPYTYTFKESGSTIGSLASNIWSWTPAGGDVGTHTIQVVCKLGTRTVFTRTFTLKVFSATVVGKSANILCLGDSWTDNSIFSPKVYDSLTAMGVTVNMVGSRGGRIFTANAGTDVCTATSHGYVDNQVVEVYADPGATLPTATGGDLAANTTYYILAIDANTFKLRRTNGGAAIDLTSAGSGTLKIRSLRERNEGRGGWKWSDYWADGSGGVASPFVNADGVFSPSYYLSTYCPGQATPTVVLTQLGVNGSVNSGDPDDVVSRTANVAQIVAKARRATKSFKADWPGVAVVHLLPSAQHILQSDFDTTYGTARTAINRWGARRIMDLVRTAYIAAFANREAEGIYLDSAQMLDTVTGFTSPDAFHPPDYTLVANHRAACVRSFL